MNGYSFHEHPQHDYPVEKVNCVVKTVKEAMRPVTRHHDNYVTQLEVGMQDYGHGSGDCERGSDGTGSRPLSDGHSDASNSSDRIFSALSEGDLSANSSPSSRRAQKSDNADSARSKDGVSSRLRPGVSSRSQRSSANLQTSSLQQDLIKLIHPDYMPHDNGVASTPQQYKNISMYGKISSGSLPEVGMSRSRENLSALSLRSHSPPTKETIVTLARPATVISNASTASSPGPGEKLSKDE
ncbi:unnamed protein product, partial [Nesidiocoris tenuis]